MQRPITLLPGDKRMDYAADYMAKKGGSSCTSWNQIPDSGYVIGGMPFTRDGKMVNTSIPEPLSIRSLLGMLTPSHILVGGNLPEPVITYCIHHRIKYYDVMTSDDFVQKNARLTAEGLLIPLLSHTTFSKLATTSSTGGLFMTLQRVNFTARPKGRCHKHLLLVRYKAVPLESSFLDSSACSLIYF